MKPLLEARQICKQFSGVTVLKHIDFTLLSGQVHALMGGNGAGKSTLMKIIAGVETPDSGELILGERTFARLTPAQAHQHPRGGGPADGGDPARADARRADPDPR